MIKKQVRKQLLDILLGKEPFGVGLVQLVFIHSIINWHHPPHATGTVASADKPKLYVGPE